MFPIAPKIMRLEIQLISVYVHCQRISVYVHCLNSVLMDELFCLFLYGY